MKTKLLIYVLIFLAATAQAQTSILVGTIGYTWCKDVIKKHSDS